MLINCLFVRQDPAVTQHSSTGGYATLDLYNPFENSTAVSNSSSPPVRRRRIFDSCYRGEIALHTLLLDTRYMKNHKHVQPFLGDVSDKRHWAEPPSIQSPSAMLWKCPTAIIATSNRDLKASNSLPNPLKTKLGSLKQPEAMFRLSSLLSFLIYISFVCFSLQRSGPAHRLLQWIRPKRGQM